MCVHKNSILDDREKEILEETNEEQDEVTHPSIIYHNIPYTYSSVL